MPPHSQASACRPPRAVEWALAGSRGSTCHRRTRPHHLCTDRGCLANGSALAAGKTSNAGGEFPASVRVISTTPKPAIQRVPRSGAGGNRTPVHQPVDELATTIPGIATDAVTPTGRLSARGGPRSVFPECQQSFPLAVVFPTVIPHFCCRAVMDWPRATFLLTMTLHSSDRNQAARANCSSAILVVAPFYESEQLGSQTRTALLTSKPVSPMFNMCSRRSPVH